MRITRRAMLAASAAFGGLLSGCQAPQADQKQTQEESMTDRTPRHFNENDELTSDVNNQSVRTEVANNERRAKADATDAIDKIEELNNLGGGKLVIERGVQNWDSISESNVPTITQPTVIEGQGTETILERTDNSPTFSDDHTPAFFDVQADNCTIRDLKIDSFPKSGDGLSQDGGANILVDEQTNCLVDNIWVRGGSVGVRLLASQHCTVRDSHFEAPINYAVAISRSQETGGNTSAFNSVRGCSIHADDGNNFFRALFCSGTARNRIVNNDLISEHDNGFGAMGLYLQTYDPGIVNGDAPSSASRTLVSQNRFVGSDTTTALRLGGADDAPNGSGWELVKITNNYFQDFGQCVVSNAEVEEPYGVMIDNNVFEDRSGNNDNGIRIHGGQPEGEYFIRDNTFRGFHTPLSFKNARELISRDNTYLDTRNRPWSIDDDGDWIDAVDLRGDSILRNDNNPVIWDADFDVYVDSNLSRDDLSIQPRRAIVNGSGENDGDPNSTGDWQGYEGRASGYGVVVRDTANNNLYRAIGGGFVQIN